MDANGNVSVGTKINLKKVTFGDSELTNVRVSVVRNQKAPLLLGQRYAESEFLSPRYLHSTGFSTTHPLPPVQSSVTTRLYLLSDILWTVEPPDTSQLSATRQSLSTVS